MKHQVRRALTYRNFVDNSKLESWRNINKLIIRISDSVPYWNLIEKHTWWSTWCAELWPIPTVLDFDMTNNTLVVYISAFVLVV
jgi:hypothetical protein